MTDVQQPTWLREIAGTLTICPQYLLTGNVLDLHIVPQAEGPVEIRPTVHAIADLLLSSGYDVVVVHDPATGLTVIPDTAEAYEQASTLTGMKELSDGPRPVTLPRLAGVLTAVAERCSAEETPNPDGPAEVRGALVLSRASRLALQPTQLTDPEHAFYVAAEHAIAHAAPAPIGPARRATFNPVFWILDRQADIPAWLWVDNSAVRSIVIPMPDHDLRASMAGVLARSFADAGSATEEIRTRMCRGFADASDNMTLREMNDATGLAFDRGLPFADINDAMLAYRVGIADNPWRKTRLRERIDAAEDPTNTDALAKRVRGQEAAVTAALDILKRSVLGLSGAQMPSSQRRPRGVLFFVGPTGVGKTELAKALAALVFGSDQAYARFDMSEFGEAHSAARLIGAPPGYVGFDQGGELTNRIRERPFSLVLFDEIEKADPRVLDKFLQVLDEGRLTDSQGSTVDFRETLLIFTSNRGMESFQEELLHVSSDGEGLPNYERLSETVLSALKDYFVRQINRPELLNRFGNNFVVFDFIRPIVAREIFGAQLGHVQARLLDEQGITLHIPDDVRERIANECCRDLTLGGRGIGNRVESYVVNPLARALFDDPRPAGSTATLRAWELTDGVATLEI